MSTGLIHLPRMPLALGSLLTFAALALMAAPRALAADDYTLPYYNPEFSLLYGVDRDPRIGFQLDYTGKTWFDTVPHAGRVYDNHTGLDYPMPVHTPIAASLDGEVIDTEGGYGTQQYGDFGNFVRVAHDDDRDTLYYHLASRADGGLTVKRGDQVAAGEKVGESGCSGYCFGPHLHLEMLVAGEDFVQIDPMYRRLWTTWPGRVPFLAEYVRESNAGTQVVRRSRTISHWVEFRNTGGRTWRTSTAGRVILGTWDPASHDSPFEASDWTNAWIATRVDATTAPNAIGRFTFGIRGGPPPGSYRETFNLAAQNVRWFDHDALGGFYVPIIVSNLNE